jgi:hypothetical protein
MREGLFSDVQYLVCLKSVKFLILLHPVFFSRQFVLLRFAVTLFGWLCCLMPALAYSFICLFVGNIILYLRFYLHPLFQEPNEGVKQENRE